jgi:hypothetical protein
MPKRHSEARSAERIAFEVYLRTGRRIDLELAAEQKFNPYHDPRNGRFTFAPGGPRSIANPIFSDRGKPWKPKPQAPGTASPSETPSMRRIAGAPDDPSLATPAGRAFFTPGGGGRGRGGRGSGARRPPRDPVLLEHAFPGLNRLPAGAILRMADGVLDLTTAAQEATGELHRAQVRQLVEEIREIDPDYGFASLGEADTLEGRVNEIKALRFDRALAYYRQRGDLGPMQLEVARMMQERADSAYEEAVQRYEAGRLTPRLSREEAIGNYIDGAVKMSLRWTFNVRQVDISRGNPIQVVRREYATDRTYRVPDARAGNIAFDVTLTRKTLSTSQIRGFFRANFRPAAVIIIRPSQLGGSYTYAIKRPERQT